MKSIKDHPYLYIPGLPYPKPVAQWTHDEALANLAFIECNFRRYLQLHAHDPERTALGRGALTQIETLRAHIEARQQQTPVH